MNRKKAAKSRAPSQTVAQKVVRAALPGVPARVKNRLASRWGSRIVLTLAAILLASGILTIQWSGGRPRLAVDRDRVEQVGEKIQQARHPDDPSLKDRLSKLRHRDRTSR